MVRATAANAQIRAFACTTRETVETARASHNTSPVVTAALGRLLSAGAMMGSMLKGDDELITLQIKGDGPIGGLTVTADMNGHVKGYANVPDVILSANAQGKLDVGGAVGAGVLSVIRDMLSGMDLEITDTLPVEFACNCSKDRVRKALISIGREELQSMIDDGETIEVNCHFCNKNYNFTVDELKQMIQ